MVKSPYTKLVTSTFSTRMSWSPDGSFLATGGCWSSSWFPTLERKLGAAAVQCRHLRGMHSTGKALILSLSPLPTWCAAGNSYQGSTHAAVVLQRGRWNEEQEHLLVSGHQGERRRTSLLGSHLMLLAACSWCGHVTK